MSAIIPFDNAAALPAYLQRKRKINANSEVLTHAAPPTLSIKGKVFTVSINGEKQTLTVNVEGEQVPRSSVQIVVVRANTKARQFYAGAYKEGESEGTAPTCSSTDGVAPLASSTDIQSPKCATCPHAVWGTGPEGKGTRCRQQTTMAVMFPDRPDTRFLLRVPPASRKEFQDAVKFAANRNLDYNQAVMRVSFDPEAATPKLLFKPVGLVSDELYEKIEELFEGDEVREMLGLNPQPAAPALPAPKVETEMSELDQALAAKAAQAKAPKPTVPVDHTHEDELEAALKPKAEAKPAKSNPKAEPKDQPAENSKASALLGDLDSFLSATDD